MPDPHLLTRFHAAARLLGLFVGLAAAAIAVVALTDTPPERAVRKTLGIGCVPDQRDSPGWRSERELSAKVDEPKAVAVGERIYLAGGIDNLVSFGKPSDVPGVKSLTEVHALDQLRRFDPASGRYRTLAKLPEPLNHFGMVVHGSDVYVLGGEGDVVGGAYPRAGFFRYRTAKNQWSRMPSMPSHRSAFASGVIGDRLYVAGGLYHGQPLRRLEIYDFRTGRWSRGPDMPSAREHVASAVAGGKLYVIGGRDRRTDALATVERFNPRAARWEAVRPLPTPRAGLGAEEVDGKVIALGGGDDRGGTVTGAVGRFDPQRGEWEALPRMMTKRHGFAVASAGGRVYTFGGSPCAYYAASDLVESFDPRQARSP